MVRTVVAFGVMASLSFQTLPEAKQMFYRLGDLGLVPVAGPRPRLRPVPFARPFYPAGIHYWLETEGGTPVTENRARSITGTFTVHLRNNMAGGFLTVWELTEGRELTPKDDRWSGGGRWSGIVMTEEVYTVPGIFESLVVTPPSILLSCGPARRPRSPSGVDGPRQSERHAGLDADCDGA